MEEHYKQKKLALTVLMLCGFVIGLSGSFAMLMVIFEEWELPVGIAISLINNFGLMGIISIHKDMKQNV